MNGRSHVAFGLAAGALAYGVAGLALRDPVGLALCLGAYVLGSLLPDIDSSESTIRHATGTDRHSCLGRLVNVFMPGHRGVVHSPILALALLAVVCYSHTPWALAGAVGWCSHIIADNFMGLAGAKNGGLIENLLAYGGLALAAVWLWQK